MHGPARRLQRVALAATVIFLALAPLALPLPAQQTAGTVQGSVTDTTAAVVPGVRLELMNVQTNVAVRQTSGAAGEKGLLR